MPPSPLVEVVRLLIDEVSELAKAAEKRDGVDTATALALKRIEDELRRLVVAVEAMALQMRRDADGRDRLRTGLLGTVQKLARHPVVGMLIGALGMWLAGYLGLPMAGGAP